MITNYDADKTNIRDSIISNNIVYEPKDIKAFFYHDYLFNLKKMLIEEKENIGYQWYDINDLQVTEKKQLKEFTDIKNNSYLKEMQDKRLLGLDIIRNGTFFPLSIIHTMEHSNEVFKGSHRIISAKLLQVDGLWDDRKFLGLDFNKKVDSTIWEFYSKTRPLIGDKFYKVPTVILYPEFYELDFDKEAMLEDLLSKNGRMINEEIAIIPISNYRTLIKILGYWGVWLNELIFLSKTKLHKEFKSSPVMNDPKLFQHWLEN